MKKNLFFSIIIPMYNSQETISRCLNSIYNSNYPRDKYEVIVVDDGSTDNSINVVKKFRCKLIRLKNNGGAANARNIGARFSKGKILFFVDSDVILGPNSLKTIDTVFKKNPKISIINGISSKKPYDNSIFTLYKSLNHHYYTIKSGRWKKNFLAPFCSAIIKKGFIKIGGFSSNIKWAGGEDEEFSSRIPKSYKTLWIPEVEAVPHYLGFIKSMIKYTKRGNVYSFYSLKHKTFRGKHPFLSFDELIGYSSSILVFFTVPFVFIVNASLLKIIILLLILIFLISKANFYFLLLKERKKSLFPIFIIISYIETLFISIGIASGVIRYLFGLVR